MVEGGGLERKKGEKIVGKRENRQEQADADTRCSCPHLLLLLSVLLWRMKMNKRSRVEGGWERKVSETTTRSEFVSKVTVASLLNVQLEQQSDVSFLESCRLVHSGLTDRSSGLELEMKGQTH